MQKFPQLANPFKAAYPVNLAFPNDQARVSEPAQRDEGLFVTDRVLLKFAPPKSPARFRKPPSVPATMAVPETAVDKNGLLFLAEYYVRTAG